VAVQFVNDPREHVAEGLAGLERAWPDLVRWNREPSFIARAQTGEPKVALVAGGGSGHEPLHTGFVGEGMLDAAVPGAIFSSPTAGQLEAATRAADRGRGVVHIIKNYTGDVLNFGIAAELVADAGIAVETVLVADDLATELADGAEPRPSSPSRSSAARPPSGAGTWRTWPRWGAAWPPPRARWRWRCGRARTPARSGRRSTSRPARSSSASASTASAASAGVRWRARLSLQRC
jgi:dihydroxyacetone kinase-like protein